MDSRPGHGTTFTLTWPPGEGVATTVKEVPLRPVVEGHQTILVAEDNDDVRQIFVAILERAGYQVLQASDGPEALRLEESHSGPIDLLLADVMMPGLKGSELAQLLRERRPELRVILTSGFGNWLDDPEQAPDCFLDKPVEAHQLLGSIRNVMSSLAVQA